MWQREVVSDSNLATVSGLDAGLGYCFMVAAFIPTRPKTQQHGAWSKQLCRQADTQVWQGTHTFSVYNKQLYCRTQQYWSAGFWINSNSFLQKPDLSVGNSNLSVPGNQKNQICFLFERLFVWCNKVRVDAKIITKLESTIVKEAIMNVSRQLQLLHINTVITHKYSYYTYW